MACRGFVEWDAGNLGVARLSAVKNVYHIIDVYRYLVLTVTPRTTDYVGYLCHEGT